MILFNMFLSLLAGIIAITLPFSTLAVVALSSARAKARDAKRISMVTQFKTALELYTADHDGHYPMSTGIELGRGDALALGDHGFSKPEAAGKYAVMPQITPDPDPSGALKYMYWSNGKGYVITFGIESERTGQYTRGMYLTDDSSGTFETVIDQDSDGLPDRVEDLFGSNVLQRDSDNDGYDDATELSGGYNPNGPGTLEYGDAGQKTTDARGRIRSDNIVSQDPIHWHTRLSIVINGRSFDIPSDIGLGTVHEPLHTHDRDGMIHIEYGEPGITVMRGDVTLGRFFKFWGKRFDQKCIFNYCNGSGGTVRFRVNGQKNAEFDSYVMHDEDQIEIVYE